MSSHYFVKEGQEPLILVHKLPKDMERVLLELLEWNPTLVSYTDYAVFFMQEDIIPDFFVTDQETDLRSMLSVYDLDLETVIKTIIEKLKPRGISLFTVLDQVEEKKLKSQFDTEIRAIYNGFVEYQGFCR